MEESRQIDILVGDVELAPYLLPMAVDDGFGYTAHLSDFLGAHAVPYHIADGYLGGCKEAPFVLETLVSIYPENAEYHLSLGYLFFGALYNSNTPPEDLYSRMRRTMIGTAGKGGEKLLKTLERSDPHLYKALTDREYETRLKDKQEAFASFTSKVTLEALGCSYEFARKRAEEQFMEAMQLSKDNRISNMLG